MLRDLLIGRLVPFVYRLDDKTRYNLKVELYACIFFGIFAGAVFPFFSVTAVRLGATGILLALITASPFMGQLFAVYWGHRSEQGPKKPYVVYSGIISRSLLIFLALTDDVNLYALFIILHFVLAVIGGPAYNSLFRKVYPLKYRGRILGKFHFIIGIIRVVVTYFVGRWLDSFGYTYIFIGASIIGIAASLIMNKINEPEDTIVTQKVKFSLKVFSHLIKNDRLLRMAIIGFFIFDFGNLILIPVYPLVQVQVLNLNYLMIGQLAIFWMVGWFITAPFWGKVVDEYRPLYSIITAVILFIFSPIIYFMRLPYYWLIIASFVNGAAGSSMEVGWVNLMLRLGGDRAAQYSGLYLTFLGLRGLMAPLTGMYLLNYVGDKYIFLVTPVLLIVGIIPFLIFYRLENRMIDEQQKVVKTY